MANFDNFNKTIAKGYNVFGQARAIAGALGILGGKQASQSMASRVVADLRTNGIARPNFAYTMISAPECLRGSKPDRVTKTGVSKWGDYGFLTHRNDSFSTPGISLATSEVRRYGHGPLEKKPYGVIYQDVTFNFILDATYNQHKFFYNWMDNMVAHHNGTPGSNLSNEAGMKPHEVAYRNTYATQIEIYYFDEQEDMSKDGSAKKKVILHNAFPIFVGDIQYNWGSTDSLIRLPVTFTYTNWEMRSPDIRESNLDTSTNREMGIFDALLKVGSAVQALSTVRNPRNIQDVVNLTNVTKTFR